MILLAGATGLLGGEIARRLSERALSFRVLLRPNADAAPFAALGAEVARGDVRDRGSLADAIADVHTVITTVTAMSRMLAGRERTTIAKTDRDGTLNLVAAAEAAGAERFVFLSAAGMRPEHRFPLARAKLAVEDRLARSRLHEIVVRPTPFQEIWLSEVVGLDWRSGKLTVYGRGHNAMAYVAVADVAEATVRLAVADSPPRLVEFGGPEMLTRNEIVDLIRAHARRELSVRHVPRAALAAGSVVLAPVKSELASVMGLALSLDRDPAPWNAEPLRALGIAPRPATEFIRTQIAAD